MTAERASIYPARDRTAWIAAQRPARGGEPDPYKPNGVFLERERLASGEVVASGVVLLTNRECPWKCLMCDLWQHTTRETVPLGAIPCQVDHAVQTWRDARVVPTQVKLYNSGSFFDPNAIPPDDYASIAERVSFARNVVVESHPLLVGERAIQFRESLARSIGRDEGVAAPSLEVAMGLETAHPEVLAKLNKKFTLDQFKRAAGFLADAGVGLRVFLLVHPPFLENGAATPSSSIGLLKRDEGVASPIGNALEWLLESVDFAFECGATAVTLIPTRAGNGAMERLRDAGEWRPPTLRELEQAQRASLDVARGRGRVFADTWGMVSNGESDAVAAALRGRIERMNFEQLSSYA